MLDHETWVMNLKEANLYGYPIWYKLYAAKDAYQMNSLRPEDWDQLITKLAENDEFFEQYYKYVHCTCALYRLRLIFFLRVLFKFLEL